jgi:cytochrome c-type biogenesis protein CcmE
MSPVKRQRLMLVGLLVLGVSAAAALMFQAFQQNMMFFFSTSEVAEGLAPVERDFRVGGVVVEQSVVRASDSLKVVFDITDMKTPIKVEYYGILPDLFREGQGIVAKGQLNAEGVFVASEVLAKHDENYMPPEVAATLHTPPAAVY